MKATAIDAKLRLYASAAVHFDTDLPHYNTKDGVHRDPHGKNTLSFRASETLQYCFFDVFFFMSVVAEEGRITGPTLMWAEALDLVLTKLRKVNFPFHKVYAISGSGQQHGSVYWANGAREAYLKTLDPLKGSLVKQLQEAFSIQDSPVWMDSSTSAQCAAIEKALGGAEKVAALTGPMSEHLSGFHCFLFSQQNIMLLCEGTVR